MAHIMFCAQILSLRHAQLEGEPDVINDEGTGPLGAQSRGSGLGGPLHWGTAA